MTRPTSGILWPRRSAAALPDRGGVTLRPAVGQILPRPALSVPQVVSFASATPSPVAIAEPVVYDLTFSEPMRSASIAVGDFSDAGTAAITIDSIAEVSPTEFSITVSPTQAGEVLLGIAQGGELLSAGGAPLDTSTEIPAATTVLAEAGGFTDPPLPAGAVMVIDMGYNPHVENDAGDNAILDLGFDQWTPRPAGDNAVLDLGQDPP